MAAQSALECSWADADMPSSVFYRSGSAAQRFDQLAHRGVGYKLAEDKPLNLIHTWLEVVNGEGFDSYPWTKPEPRNPFPLSQSNRSYTVVQVGKIEQWLRPMLLDDQDVPTTVGYDRFTRIGERRITPFCKKHLVRVGSEHHPGFFAAAFNNRVKADLSISLIFVKLICLRNFPEPFKRLVGSISETPWLNDNCTWFSYVKIPQNCPSLSSELNVKRVPPYFSIVQAFGTALPITSYSLLTNLALSWSFKLIRPYGSLLVQWSLHIDLTIHSMMTAPGRLPPLLHPLWQGQGNDRFLAPYRPARPFYMKLGSQWAVYGP